MKKLIWCAIVAAVVAQVWGMVSWMVLPWHMLDFKQFKDDTHVAEVLRAELQGSGLYTLPNMDPTIHENEAAMVKWKNKARKGPFAFLSVKADGVEPGMGLPMAIGFFLNLVMAGILFWLVSNNAITCPKGRTIFIAVAGSVGALYTHLSNWNWWHFPINYCVVGVIDVFVTWTLAGFAMVKLADWLDSKNTE